MKSRIIIRELIPIIGFFRWEGTVDPFHIQFIRNYNCKQPKWNDKEECLVKQVRAELGQASALAEDEGNLSNVCFDTNG